MKNIWLYTPEICDGDFCPKDCDACPKKELIFEREEGESMSDYISRQEAVDALAGWKISPIVLDPVPSDDVVEVVRCKDCKHYKRNIPCVGGHYNGCDEWIDEGNAITVYDNDFCSYGERKEK